jgi:hypothetical protein
MNKKEKQKLKQIFIFLIIFRSEMHALHGNKTKNTEHNTQKRKQLIR